MGPVRRGGLGLVVAGVVGWLPVRGGRSDVYHDSRGMELTCSANTTGKSNRGRSMYKNNLSVRSTSR